MGIKPSPVGNVEINQSAGYSHNALPKNGIVENKMIRYETNHSMRISWGYIGIVNNIWDVTMPP